MRTHRLLLLAALALPPAVEAVRPDPAADLQAKIDAAAAAGGGVVRLPAGRSPVTRTLRGRPGVSIRGEGCGVSVLAAKIRDGGPVLSYEFAGDEYARHVDLADFAIEGDGRSDGIKLRNVTDSLLSRVRVEGCRNGMVWGSGTWRTGASGCVVQRNREAGLLLTRDAAYTGANGGRFVGGALRQNRVGLQVGEPGVTPHVLVGFNIDGTTVEGNRECGLDVSQSRNVRAVGLYCESSPWLAKVGERGDVDGLTIEGCSAMLAAGTGGVSVSSGRNVSLVDNRFYFGAEPPYYTVLSLGDVPGLYLRTNRGLTPARLKTTADTPKVVEERGSGPAVLYEPAVDPVREGERRPAR